MLEELHAWKNRLGAAPSEASENDPRRPVSKTIGYLEHNRRRMNYHEYRRQGMPVTTVRMESLVKEINSLAKGTEMFWNDPEGVESILQVRVAAFCDTPG